MCLAVPHTLIELTGPQTAVGRAGTVEVEVRTDLIDTPALGDRVLVHAGFAIEKLRPEEADEVEALWEMIRANSGTVSNE
jgi:hydrogenase expression/formation protein HypC